MILQANLQELLSGSSSTGIKSVIVRFYWFVTGLSSRLEIRFYWGFDPPFVIGLSRHFGTFSVEKS